MSDWDIGEYISITIQNNNDIKEPNRGHQNCNTSQILTFSGYVKAELLFGSLSIWFRMILWRFHLDNVHTQILSSIHTLQVS